MSYLVITQGGELIREVSLSGQVVGIGRDTRNEVCLPSETNDMSRFHAVLVATDESANQYFVRDLSSVRGVWVNGMPVYQRLLEDQDTIEIAGYNLLYQRARGAAGGSRIRIVAQRRHTDGNATTQFALPIPASFGGAQREEFLQAVITRAASAPDLRTFLSRLMPALVRVAGAERGFAGIFRGGGFEDTGLVALGADDQIEISTPDFIERLQSGQTVRDTATLLVPIREQKKSVGFLCLDRAGTSVPFDDDDERFLILVGRLMCSVEGRTKSQEAERALSWPRMLVGKSRAMQTLLREIDEASASGMHVLIQGDSGSGKELVAEWLHKRSAKRNGFFMARSCATITESLADSQVFGYAARAGISGADPGGMPGWFETANGGVLFLDEIQALTPGLQERFLRVLEERQVWRVQGRAPIRIDVLVIAATDQNLEIAVERGSFSKALYHRFGRRIYVPPLRERLDDVRLLAHYFLDKSAAERGTATRMISQRALTRLSSYQWPGNVRELQNCMMTCATTAGEVLFSWDVPEYLGAEAEPEAVKSRPVTRAAAVESSGGDHPIKTMADVEREKIMEALVAFRGNITKAAQALGYKSRMTILHKMDQYSIPRDFGDA